MMRQAPATKHEEIQAAYYNRTADVYDALHLENEEHTLALRFVIAMMRLYGLRRILLVGSGTGRGIREFQAAGFDVTGIEPVQAMIDEGEKRGVPSGVVVQGYGQSLPFEHGYFDAACSFGILHHIQRPDTVIREMLRVSRTAVFLSDNNRFGRRGPLLRLVKLLLWKAGLWPLAYYLWTRGRNCDFSESDGLAYSYSVYDNFDRIDAWADRTVLVPTHVEGRRRSSWFHPLLTSSHVLLCAFRERPGEGPGRSQVPE